MSAAIPPSPSPSPTPRDAATASADGRAAADRLLDRPAPPGYLETWATSVAAPLAGGSAVDLSALAFRLGPERFLLTSACVREVHVPRRVHRVPGRSNEVFRGLVVLRGEIHLCADLHALLGCEREAEGASPRRRMVVIERPGERWAFQADEVLDVHRHSAQEVAAPQVTVAKASVRFTDGLVTLPTGAAARLDPERLFAGLSRSLG